MKIERGVMVMKDGKAWGVVYQDGHSTQLGWVNPEDAPIHRPEHCTRVDAVCYRNDPNLAEVRKGNLVHVERRTEVVIKEPTQ